MTVCLPPVIGGATEVSLPLVYGHKDCGQILPLTRKEDATERSLMAFGSFRLSLKRMTEVDEKLEQGTKRVVQKAVCTQGSLLSPSDLWADPFSRL